MVLSEGFTDAGSTVGSSLELAKSEDGLYVRAIYLSDAGVALNFAAPKPGLRKLAKASSTTMASASGTH